MAISTAAILVRLAPGVSPIAAGFWRTLIVGLLLAPGIIRARRNRTELRGADLAWTALAGLILALHFWAWFESITRTTVLRSTLLVCLTPIWAGIMEWGLLKQAPARRFWVGISITLLGVALMTGGSEEGSSSSGDLLALLGGVLAAAYLLIGRVVRPRVQIDLYSSILCLSCAAWLCIPAAWLQLPMTGFSSTEWTVLIAMALGPQLLGHIGLNYAVRYLPTAIVTSVVLLEPVGAAILGAVIPSISEIPGPWAILGGVLALVGVFCAIRPDEAAAPVESPSDLRPADEPSMPSHESRHAPD